MGVTVYTSAGISHIHLPSANEGKDSLWLVLVLVLMEESYTVTETGPREWPSPPAPSTFRLIAASVEWSGVDLGI